MAQDLNRIVWIARIAGIVILLVCLLLMLNLHARLSGMSRQRRDTPVEGR